VSSAVDLRNISENFGAEILRTWSQWKTCSEKVSYSISFPWNLKNC